MGPFAHSSTTKPSASSRFASPPSASTPICPPQTAARLDDYARGVNLFIAQCDQSNTLPPEFRLLFYRPQPWTGADSISVGL
jgi:acyl-homoserine lactone acylase PvdQ